MEIYGNIDMERSGERMKSLIIQAGYSVQSIQNYLHLSCPQPVYRWFRGQILPTVDHLFMLSKLLGVHMEDFLVEKGENCHMDNIFLDIEIGRYLKRRWIIFYADRMEGQMLLYHYRQIGSALPELSNGTFLPCIRPV